MTSVIGTANGRQARAVRPSRAPAGGEQDPEGKSPEARNDDRSGERPLPAVPVAESRLVVVSNRVADLRKKTQTGGLAVGIADALKARGGIWFGWNGRIEPAGAPEVEEVGKVRMISAPLSRQDYDQFYLGYANGVLWPLFHYRLDLVKYEESDFAGYRRVNADFARNLAPFLEADDLVWVHDYHLVPLARELRALGVRQRIGYFLHIPFPPPDLFAASPNHAWLAASLLQYDLLGFQTRTDLENFRTYAESYLGASLSSDHIHWQGRRTRAGAFPIGIEVNAFRRMAEGGDESVFIDRIRRGFLERKQIIGVDRLDYSKGLPDRMRAFVRLLEMEPDLEKKVSYLQIAPPTREDLDAYARIRSEVEGLAGAINGRFSDIDWLPIGYIQRKVHRRKLAVLFRDSEVGFVAPLRDGMNLVAKEYVAAQDPQDPGVLVLSRFAGAAEQMKEALQVNPFDVDAMARGLRDALRMPLDERRGRHAALYRRIARQDCYAWLESFLAALTPEGEAARPAQEALCGTSSLTTAKR